MSLRKVLKRIVIIFTVVCILTISIFVCSRPKPVKAEPITIGAAAIVAAVCAGLAASGITLSTNSSSSSSFAENVQTLAENFSYAGKQLNDFYASSYDDYVSVVRSQYQNKYFFLMSQELIEWIDAFGDFLVTTHNISTSTTPLLSGSFVDTNLGKLPVYSSIIPTSASHPQSIVPTSIGSDTVLTIGDKSQRFSVVTSSYSGFSRLNVYHRTGQGEWVQGSNMLFATGTGHIYLCLTGSGSNRAIQSAIYYTSTNGDTTYSVLVDANFYYTNTGISNISLDGSLADGYQDYQDAFDNVKSDNVVGVDVGTLDGVSAEDVYQNYLDRTVATGTTVGTLTGGYADDKAAEDDLEGSVVPSGAWYNDNIIIVDGLEDFFPFCIPWDIYELIQRFNVPPEAPEFDLDIGFAGLWQDESIHFDFSAWDTAARIFRICIVVGFIFFLIVKTRDLIRG